jgi:putative polyhydroxyalkanoate system protein
MADIELRRVHNLGIEAAREAAERMADKLSRQFDLKGTWQGNVLRFERPGVTGSLTLGEKDLQLSVALGFLLKAMRASIEHAVEEQLDQLFVEKKGAPAPKAQKASAPRKKGG